MGQSHNKKLFKKNVTQKINIPVYIHSHGDMKCVLLAVRWLTLK